ncbi:MAG: HAD family hydrolase [Mycoplasma sp.]
MKKLFTFDLDGTLLNSNKEISDLNISAINKLIDLGHVVIIATGRNLSQISKYLEQLSKVKYFVLLNGGCFWDNFDKKIEFISKPLNRKVIERVSQFIAENKRELQFSNYDRLFRVYFGKNIFEDIKEEGFFKDSTKNPVFDEWKNVEHIFEGPIIRIAMRAEKTIRTELMNIIKNEFKDDNSFELSESSNTYVEIDPHGISKYNTVMHLAKDLDVDTSDIYSFGDSENDISLLSKVKNAIVVENANSKVKAHAKHIIGDNNSDSIADFINKFIEQS